MVLGVSALAVALAVAYTTGAKGKTDETISLRAAAEQVLVQTLTPVSRPTQTSAKLALDVLATPVPPIPTASRTPTPSATPDAKLKTSADSASATQTKTAPTATQTPTKTATPTPTKTVTPTITGTVTITPTSTLTTGSSVSLSQYESQLFQLHNQQRAANGVQPFSIDSTLESIARQRAQNMAQSGSFSHYNSDGTTVFDMMNADGYRYTDGAENIHFNYGYSDSDSVQVAMDSFMNSSPHRANILKASLRRIGIGIAHASDGKIYYSVVFSN